MEAIFGTFTVNMPVKPTDLGILQLKFAGTCHSLQTHILDIRLLIVYKNDRNSDRFSFRFYFFL